MDEAIMFWAVLGVLGFALALAVQMRAMIGLLLRFALFDAQPDLSLRDARLLVVEARAQPEAGQSEAARALATRYPGALSHLRLARRACIILPVMIALTLLVGRFGVGVI